MISVLFPIIDLNVLNRNRRRSSYFAQLFMTLFWPETPSLVGGVTFGTFFARHGLQSQQHASEVADWPMTFQLLPRQPVAGGGGAGV